MQTFSKTLRFVRPVPLLRHSNILPLLEGDRGGKKAKRHSRRCTIDTIHPHNKLLSPVDNEELHTHMQFNNMKLKRCHFLSTHHTYNQSIKQTWTFGLYTHKGKPKKTWHDHSVNSITCEGTTQEEEA